jgi:primosomal protein N' (replication factor Y) (superfamily II helicase)
LYAEIIIPLAVPKNYTWKIPEEFLDKVSIGIRVEVDLRNRKYTGIIANLHNEKPITFEPKNIISILDEEPLIYPAQLKLWQWMAHYYMCTQGEVMNAAVPSYFKLNSESIIVFNEEYGDDFSLLNNEEFLVAEALLIKKELKLSEVQQILDSGKIYPVIKQLAIKKICFIWESLKDKYVPKKETYIILNPQYDNEENLSDLLNNWTKAPKQMELLLGYLHLLKIEGSVVKSELLKKASATDAQLKGLIDKNILISEKREINRLVQLPLQVTIDFELNDEQVNAVQKIIEAFDNKQNCLLHGITGSGKTQVYIKLLETIIKQGKQALYLVPEIALTAQLIRRLQVHFGGYIAVYHSKFNDSERVELWNKVKTGELKIVMGARSALLLPYRNLDLIIVDEEHEPSYKQYEPAPRYHARDTALFYAAQCNAKVLLGSATPSVETYYNVSTNKLALVKLDNRFGGIPLPIIEIVDTKLANKNQKEKVIITPELKDEIDKNLANGKQIILFKNRRGYIPYKTCSTCGWMPECKHCNVALTYHKNKNHLICHYCNTIYNTINTCMACGATKFEEKNFGTEKIEEAVTAMFPNAKVGRMDLDSVKGKNAHTNLIQQFEQGKIDILIGTQMLVKGLDFEHVQLVGILDADSLLNFADFRVHERAFQLMEQVSGRAGRKHQQGKVLIQAMQNGHPLLQLIQQHDYQSFYKKEIEERKQFFYPPFSRLIQVQFKHKNEGILQKAAEYFSTHIDPKYQKYMIGPAAPFINKIRNQFILEILFKLPKDTTTIQACKLDMQKQFAILQNTREYSTVVIIPNVDPV